MVTATFKDEGSFQFSTHDIDPNSTFNFLLIPFTDSKGDSEMKSTNSFSSTSSPIPPHAAIQMANLRYLIQQVHNHDCTLRQIFLEYFKMQFQRLNLGFSCIINKLGAFLKHIFTKINERLQMNSVITFRNASSGIMRSNLELSRTKLGIISRSRR